MTYLIQEKSVQSNQPIELYQFSQVLGTASYTYTSSDSTIVYAGNSYVPAAITRTAPKISTKSSSGQITLTFPRTDPFVVRYLDGEPPLPDHLTIYRYHETDGAVEVTVFFAGDVRGVTFQKDTAKVVLTTLSERLERTIPKRTFAWSCSHVLFNSLCKIAKESYRSDVLIQSISTDGYEYVVDHDPAWAGDSVTTRVGADSSYFSGGLMTLSTASGSYHRTIQRYTLGTTTLRLNIPIGEASVGAVIKLYAGCNHAVQTCNTKFNNVLNYGGFPFVPTSNPFADGIITGG